MTAVDQTVAAELEALPDIIDDRTREILERRRRGSTVRRRGWLVRRALAAADIAGLLGAFLLAQWLFGVDDGGPSDLIDMRSETLLFALTMPAWIVVAKLYGLYDRDEERTDHSTADDIVGVFHMVTIGTWLFFAGAWVTGLADPQLPKLMVFWIVASLMIPTVRVGARALCRRHAAYIQNTVIVGAGDVGQTIARKILNHPEYGLNVVGFVDDERADPGDLEPMTLLGSLGCLRTLIDLLDVERVIVAFSNEPGDKTVALVRELQTHDVQIDVVPRLFELFGPSVSVHTVEGLPLLGLPPVRLPRSSAFLKRGLDLGLAIPGLIVVSPLLILIAAAIKLDSRGPVGFRQVRVGAHGPFRMWKFRTMWIDADEHKHEFAHMNAHLASGGDSRMFKIENDPRVTRVGRFLRRYSLDELPQLFNVLAGDMSLVGPRPLISEEASEVREWGRRRLSLKPGMTGLWQVLGSSRITFEEMVSLDYLYVTNWSLWGDIRLILRTLPVVTRAENR